MTMHIPIYKRSNFQPALDVNRPHTALTLNPAKSSSLRYRYDDTQEEIEVPNVWYNQTYQERVAAVRWQAQLQDEAANQYAKTPPLGRSPEAVRNFVERYRAKAIRIRSEAERMEAAGSVAHPVAASLLTLNIDHA